MLVPQTEVEPVLLALETWSLNYWTAREVLQTRSSESSITIIWGDLLIVTSMPILERLIQQGPVKCILKSTVGQFLTYCQSVP